MDRDSSKAGRRRSRNIRRLGEATDQKTQNRFTSKILPTLKVLSLALPLALVIFCVITGTPIMQFANCYQQQYNQIIHGSCKPDIDTDDLLLKMNEHNILHQTDALQSLQKLLSNNSELTSIAFVGKPGVGKSLVAKALLDSFPWHTNVLRYFWNTHVKEDVEKFQMLRYFLNRLSDCGRNLLMIDNLAPCDSEIVTILQQFYEMVQKEKREYQFFPDTSEKYLIIVYLFSLDTMEYNEDLLKTQYDKLQKLPNTTTINFHDFDTLKLKDCIKREAALENINLTEDVAQQVLAAINPKINGCKNVRAKLLMYAQN